MEDNAPTPIVSVIIPCRDELRNLPMVIDMLRSQTLPPGEVIFADGMSTDGTREALTALREQFPVLVVDNPARHVPHALNIAAALARGRYLARMDTHARYAPDYLERVVSVLEERPAVAAVGGAMSTEGRGPWGMAIASTLSRRFGLGGASHRVGAAGGPVTHVFSGCYRSDVVTAVGGWNEQLRANEDFEADVRVAEFGQVWLEPSAHSTWFVRESLPALAKQMWRYGFYKAATITLHPRSLKLRQLAPPAVVVVLAWTTAVDRRVGAGVLGGYLAVSGVLGAWASRQDGADPLKGAAVPAVVHLSWGGGLLAGFVPALASRVADVSRAVRA